MQIRDLVLQINTLRTLKKFGTVTTYKLPLDTKKYELTILVFSDASKTDDGGQLGCKIGLLVGKFAKGSTSTAFAGLPTNTNDLYVLLQQWKY